MALLSVVAGACMAVGCVPRATMCSAASACPAQSVCVAGRCQSVRPEVKPAVDAARRWVVRPVDLAFVRRGDGASRALPPLIVLGRDDARLFLRFSVDLPPAANVVEAYVVLRRSPVVDDDPTPFSLHATRIVQDWSSGSTSWALQPRTTSMRLPTTRVDPIGRALVRVDVRDLVRQWRKRDRSDHGIAIEAAGESATGTAFALADSPAEPYLEFYIR
jgi:hypothetical protein